MEIKEGKIIFNKEMAEKLSGISIKVMDLIYGEIEKLGLSEKEEVMAHYYVAKNYYDSMQNTLMDMGYEEVKIKKIKLKDEHIK